MQGEQMSREDKFLSEYQQLRNGLEKVGAMISQMYQQQIKQSSEYLKVRFRSVMRYRLIDGKGKRRNEKQ